MRNEKRAGVILSYTSEAIKILSHLIYTPIMLRLLGKSEYGLYQLVASVVSYLGLLSLGFSASYVRFYTRYKAEGNKEKIASFNGMFLTIFLFFSLIAILCGIVLIANIELVFQEGLTAAEYSTARVLMIILIINLALTFPSSVFSCILTAHEKFFFQRLMGVLANILNPFLSIPLLLLGYGSVGLVVAITVITLSHFLVNIWYVCFRLREKFLFKHFELSLLKQMWGFTFFIFLNQIIDRVNWSVDRILLGRMIDTSAVAVYGLGAQINTMYKTLSTSISSVFVPQINRIVAESNDNHKLTGVFTRVGRIQFFVLILAVTGFIFLGKPFMYFWGGPGFEDSYYVALWLIIPVTIPLIQNIGIEIQRAKNMHRTRSIVYSLIAIGNIFLSIPLIRAYGPIGASVGTGISLILGNVLFMNWYYQMHIELDMKYFWKSIATILPSLVVPIIIGILIMEYVHITTILKLVLWAGIYGTAYCIFVWCFGMNQSEKMIVIGFKNSIMKKVRRK